MAAITTRRESLGLLGVGLSALTGCGGVGESSGLGGGGSGGMAGDAGSGSGAVGAAGTSAGSGVAAGPEGGAPSGGAGGSGGPGTVSEAGAAGEAGAGGGDAACVAKNEATAGPFPNLSPLLRRDVRANTTGVTAPKEGAELLLRIKVMDLGAFCAPIEGAVVDIWQCDALGLYAGYGPFATVGQDFLRGYQRTDAQGVAEFLTIFPGSYAGRAVHIHFSIRASEGVLSPNASGEGEPDVFIAQLYFADQDVHAVFDAYPIYQGGAAMTPNSSDGIFLFGGDDLMLSLRESLTGYVADVTIGVSRAGIGM